MCAAHKVCTGKRIMSNDRSQDKAQIVRFNAGLRLLCKLMAPHGFRFPYECTPFTALIVKFINLLVNNLFYFSRNKFLLTKIWKNGYWIGKNLYKLAGKMKVRV